MRKTILMLFSILVLSGSLMAQGDMPRRQKKVTYEQMTEKMVKELQLDEKQQKKVAKLNKKYKTLIEGEQAERPQGQRPPMGERPSGRPSGGMGGPGSRNQNIIYSGATELKAAVTETGKTYQSSKIDENALLINTKEAVTIAQPTINKTGSSSGGDNCSFYGVNAALLVKGGSYHDNWWWNNEGQESDHQHEWSFVGPDSYRSWWRCRDR